MALGVAFSSCPLEKRPRYRVREGYKPGKRWAQDVPSTALVIQLEYATPVGMEPGHSTDSFQEVSLVPVNGIPYGVFAALRIG